MRIDLLPDAEQTKLAAACPFSVHQQKYHQNPHLLFSARALAHLPITLKFEMRDTYHGNFVIIARKGTMPSTRDRKNVIAHRTWLIALLFLTLLCKTSSAQSSQEAQFLPEIDAYLKLNPKVRVSAQAKDTRDGGDPTQAEIGPSVDFYLKPLIKLREITLFDLDDAKARPLVLTGGYRYLSAPTSPSTNRMVLAATLNIPIKAKLLLTDRNRADLDWSNGGFTWRYRNMLSLQRTLELGSYHLIPYASSEFYYESQYRKWSTTELYAGSLFPLGKHFQLKAYYEHQNNTGKRPNKQLHGVGLALNIYFSPKNSSH
jgi:hypothetical protein